MILTSQAISFLRKAKSFISKKKKKNEDLKKQIEMDIKNFSLKEESFCTHHSFFRKVYHFIQLEKN